MKKISTVYVDRAIIVIEGFYIFNTSQMIISGARSGFKSLPVAYEYHIFAYGNLFVSSHI